MFAYDFSVMYLFCFLTKKKLTILKKLPFCGYGVGPHQDRKVYLKKFIVFIFI